MQRIDFLHKKLYLSYQIYHSASNRLSLLERKVTKMKVIAHLVVSKDYGKVISASRWIDEALIHCEEHNMEHHGEEYLSKPKDRAVVSVEFEVPDSVFERLPVPVLPATVVKEN